MGFLMRRFISAMWFELVIWPRWKKKHCVDHRLSMTLERFDFMLDAPNRYPAMWSAGWGGVSLPCTSKPFWRDEDGLP